ncbi:ANR family transcriptional regulator [Vibrio jasicida]|uniref:ANR family transcriptional regulator n=1 Tax=Vibrio jasicida TaxID=766224 RepID=UPI0005EFC706
MYLEWAKQACESERQSDWSKAIECWKLAHSSAREGSKNKGWAENRLYFCCNRAGIRLNAVLI